MYSTFSNKTEEMLSFFSSVIPFVYKKSADSIETGENGIDLYRV